MLRQKGKKMRIVENGMPVCGIVLPSQPSPREIFSAQELIKYIEKISGAKLEISDRYKNKILIGGPERNQASETVMSRDVFEALVPGPEGFIIDITEHTLLLAGSSQNSGELERGTLYAVYELLERYLGCSFAAYSKNGVDAGELVPRTCDVAVAPDRFVKSAADVGYRTAIVQYGPWVGKPEHPLNESFISWLAKNRYNRILTWSGVYEGYKKNGMLEEAVKRGIMFSVGHHEAIEMLLPHKGNAYFAEHYAETHPEYYKLLEDGTRHIVKDNDFSGQLILCMRNEDLIHQMAENIVKWADENPQVDVIALWPYDGKHEQCCCELCKPHTKSANYSYFVSQIEKLVWKKRPGIRLDRISYLDIMECEDVSLSPNVVVNKAVWHEKLRTIGKKDGSCLADTEYEENILSWKHAGATVVYYDYLMGIYSCRQRWMPAADEMQAICKRFCEKGIYGLGTQMEVFHLWNHIFNFYTYGRTAYDTTLSMEDNLNRFAGIFGAGAEYMKEIIRTGEAVLDGQAVISRAPNYLMEHIDKHLIYELYEKALQAAEDAYSRNNIKLMRMVFRYSDLDLQRQKFVENMSNEKWSATIQSAELWYMRQNFDSYLSGQEGYGIAILAEDEPEMTFEPDDWYMFE